jgi:hypothetical protein
MTPPAASSSTAGRRRLPGIDALDRARSLLLDVASRDRSGPLAAGLAHFESWESLAAIAETPWLSPARRPSAVVLRAVRHRLRLLGSAPSTFAAAAAHGSTDPVHLRGVCAPLPARDPGADLWRRELVEDETGRWMVDAGHDFALADGRGAAALVLAAGGRLVNAERLRPGDEVSVFGFADEASDPGGLARSPHGRGGPVLALRAGAELPLLVSLIKRYDPGDDGPRQ